MTLNLAKIKLMQIEFLYYFLSDGTYFIISNLKIRENSQNRCSTNKIVEISDNINSLTPKIL